MLKSFQIGAERAAQFP